MVKRGWGTSALKKVRGPHGIQDALPRHRRYEPVDRVPTRTVHGHDIIGIDPLPPNDGLRDHLCKGRHGEMESAEYGVDMPNAGDLPGILHRIDDPVMGCAGL
jgi:hypothetical protein